MAPDAAWSAGSGKGFTLIDDGTCRFPKGWVISTSPVCMCVLWDMNYIIKYNHIICDADIWYMCAAHIPSNMILSVAFWLVFPMECLLLKNICNQEVKGQEPKVGSLPFSGRTKWSPQFRPAPYPSRLQQVGFWCDRSQATPRQRFPQHFFRHERAQAMTWHCD